MEEERPLLPASKPVMKKIRSSRGFLPKVRLKLARIMKALGRSAARLRPRSKPSFRLNLCMQKDLQSTTKGKPPHTPYFNSYHMSHVKAHKGLVTSAHHHVNDPFQPPPSHHPRYCDGGRDDDDKFDSESLALLHSRTSNKHGDISPTPHVNLPLRKKAQPSNDHLVLSCNPKKHGHMAFIGHDDHWLKLRIRRWQHRMNGTLTSLGPHKMDHVPRDVPKGCVGVYVGLEQTRFIVPILHLNHPLFASLFECMHDNEGFSQSGPLWIPCDVAEFETLHSQVKQLSKKHRHGYSL
ncbi:hypothetical protein GOP47_0023276 [Adiantum capillus-veneris]|uniref:Uncharacterized protein n=1 Tax=Adiantum capillus-veneris TaxID=13818 RepID=A0A9D4Z6T4_ADICA|nr:hypothetical protein GOP47_0023276 [Adiantum capillus-veneris]